MARSPIPDPLSRRHMLEKELDASQARKIAEAYLVSGRTCEAVTFLQKAGDDEALAQLCGTAIDVGDVFLLKSASAALGREPTAEQWESAAAAAEAAGKLRYASTAQRQALGDED